MILLPYSRPWTQQPQGSFDLAAESPLSQGLEAVLLGNEFADALGRRRATPSGGPTFIAASDKFGPALAVNWDGSNDEVSFGAFPFLSEFSLLTWVLVRPLLAEGYRTTIRTGDVFGTNANFAFGLRDRFGNGAEVRPFCYARNAGTLVGFEASAGVAAGWRRIGVSWRSGAQTIYVDGVAFASAATGNGADGGVGLSFGGLGDSVNAVRINTPTFDSRVYSRVLSAAEFAADYADPWQIYRRRIWVTVSVASGAITIDGNVGNATAAGTAGQIGVAITVDATTGNATAAGTTAQAGVSIDITGSVGNAAAAGVTGLPGVSLDIAATTGNAVAAGITGVVDLGGSITIDGNVGAAVAAGVQGLPGVAVTIDGAAGGAVAAGVSGSVSVTNDITINATAGNAVAAGILAGLSLDIEVAGVIGNATAAGTTGTVSLSGSGTGATAAEIWSYTLSNGLTAEATVVAIHTMLSELHLIHGLTVGSPLSVTVASRAAGAVSQAVAEAAGTVTVTRQ